MTEAPTRLLRVITRLNIGGPARQVLMLHRELARRGYACELVSGAPQAEEGTFPPPAERYTRVDSLRRETDFAADARAISALTRQMRAWSPAIVHTHTTTAGGLGRIAARRAKVPVVVHTAHGHVLSGYLSGPQTKLLTAAERWLARHTDVLVTVSHRVRDELLALGIGRPEQWRVVPLGLELGDLLAGPAAPAPSREALGLPPDGPLVGIVGRLAAIKDHDTFLAMAAQVARARPDVTFVVAGDGGLRQTLERTAGSVLGDRVRFLGWITDLPVLYGALDLVVLTSRNEGTPVALIEAGAAGRPVVATDVGGVPEVVRDGETGYVVPARDPAATAARALQILAAPELAARFGAAGREWVRSRFSAERLVEDLSALYAEQLERKGLPVPDPAPDPTPDPSSDTE
ncbi:MAG TPA: glycosyltransferase [Actinomycetota bacterium]|nr:glycosyltransferase [Actinomycetota bacterium]